MTSEDWPLGTPSRTGECVEPASFPPGTSGGGVVHEHDRVVLLMRCASAAAMKTGGPQRARLSLAAATVAGVCLLSGCGSGSTGTSASCVPPQLRVDPGTVRLGEAVQLHGTAFTDSCADTSYPAPVHSLQGLTITIEQAGRSQLLSRVDAQGTRGTFEVTVRLPLTLKKGPATVRVGSTAAAPLQLV